MPFKNKEQNERWKHLTFVRDQSAEVKHSFHFLAGNFTFLLKLTVPGGWATDTLRPTPGCLNCYVI